MNDEDILRAKLFWRCKRGMLELDILLERFMMRYFDRMTQDERVLLEALLQEPDPDLYNWILGAERHPESKFHTLIHAIQAHSNA